MPKVGKGNKVVHYPYSEKGIKDAIAHGNRTGESVTMEYGHGGRVMPPTSLATPNAQSMQKTKMVNSLINNLYPQNTMKDGGKVIPKYRGGGMVSPMNNLANRIAMLKKGGKINK